MSIKLGQIVRTKRHFTEGIVYKKTVLYEEDKDWIKDQRAFGNIPKNAFADAPMIHILCVGGGSVCIIEDLVEKDEDKDGLILSKVKEQNKWYDFYFD